MAHSGLVTSEQIGASLQNARSHGLEVLVEILRPVDSAECGVDTALESLLAQRDAISS